MQALRRKGVEATLVVFNRYRLHPEADWSLDRPRGFLAGQLVQWRALLRLLPRFDVFHFYFGLTLVPKRLQFPILRATGRKSVYHFLGSDIRGKTPAELAYADRADACIVGSHDAARWLPQAHVVPPGVDLRRLRPCPPADRARPLVVHAPSSRARKGTEHVIAACDSLPVDLDIVEGVSHEQALLRYQKADIVVDQLNAGWYGVFAIEAMALAKPVVTFLHEDAVRRAEEAFGLRLPLVPATKEPLAEPLRRLVESPQERRRIGEESRAYVEQVHDADRIADRLLEIYADL